MGYAKLKHGTLKGVTTRDREGRVLEQFRGGIIVPGVTAPPKPSQIGLGDLTARFAQPIAMLIDSITEKLLDDSHRKALSTCGGCARRHNKLNLLCPDVLTCPVMAQLLAILPSFARNALLEASAKFAKTAKP